MSSSSDTGLDIASLKREVMIDHHFLGEIAQTAGSRDRLEREDIRLFYGLSKSEYTREMHEALLAEITRSGVTKISLWDDFISPFKESRRLLRSSDFNSGFQCEMKKEGIPTEVDAFAGYISDKSAANRESTRKLSFQVIGHYLPAEGLIGKDKFDTIRRILKVQSMILDDVDRARSAEVQKFFTSRGCECVEKYEDLLRIYLKDIRRTDIVSEKNKRFNGNIVCYVKRIVEAVSDFASRMKTQRQRDRHRKKHKSITRTNFDRMLKLQKYMELARRLSARKKPFIEKVLIVGPGLEAFNAQLGIRIPRQSLEPYAVIDHLLRSGWAVFQDLQVDVVDINESVVVDHYRAILRKARDGECHNINLISDENPDFFSFGNGFTGLVLPGGEDGAQIWGGKHGQMVVGIHSAVSSRILPIAGNIITDHIAEDSRYDLVIMLNTLPYFTSAEKALALENIARMMTAGGVLMTDEPESGVVKRFPGCGGSFKSQLKKKRIFGPFRTPIQIYTKD